MLETETTFTPARITRARVGVVVMFVASGLLIATFAARLVLIRQSLGVTPGQMGWLLMAITAGSIALMPVTGHLVERFGEIALLRVFTAVGWASLLVSTYFATRGWAWAMAVPLFVQGAMNGAWDVSMNVAGGRVEQGLGRSIMPQFHAGFSSATLLGAGVGWLFAHSAAPLMWHIGVVAAIGLAVVQYFISWLLPPAPIAAPAAETAPSARAPKRPGSAWLEPRTWLIGVVMLSVSLTEGSANDWISSAIVQSFKTPEATGIACLVTFLASMTLMRILGTRLVDIWGRVTALRACAGCAIAGLLLFGLGPHLWTALLGAAIWGLGAALGFPVGISAASDDPLRAAQRTAVVSTIGYVAFLGGPPVLGMIADHVGFRNALMFILIPAVVSLLLAGWTRPLRAGDD